MKKNIFNTICNDKLCGLFYWDKNPVLSFYNRNISLSTG